MPLKVSNGFSRVALKLTPVISIRGPLLVLAIDPFLEGQIAISTTYGTPSASWPGLTKYLKLFGSPPAFTQQLPQMLLADDAEQFRAHRAGVLLQQTQQLFHALVIDLGLGAEEPVQRHVRRAEFAQNLLLLVGRAHAPELGDEIPHRGLLPAGSRMPCLALLVAGDQRPGIALDLLQRIPVRRGRIAGPVLAPVGIGGV